MKPITVLTLAAAAAFATAASAQIAPGQWEITSTITAIDGTAIPPAIAKLMIGKAVTVKNCVTPEQAKQGPHELLKTSKNCTVSKYSSAGGRYSSEIVCKNGGFDLVSTGSGQYTSTGFSGVGKAVMSGKTSMTQSQTVVGKLVGPCK